MLNYWANKPAAGKSRRCTAGSKLTLEVIQSETAAFGTQAALAVIGAQLRDEAEIG